MLFKSLITTAFLSLASVVKCDDFPTIEIVGNKFFYANNGSQFYIKGVAYQEDVSNSSTSSFTDPLADSDTCSRDIPYLQELGTNVIRVYAVNTSLDHSDCMQQFQDANIYVIADLSEPSVAIDTTDPDWSVDLYERYTSVIDAFADYENVLGFFAGNEVITNTSTSDAAPFVKAAIRDMKAYISDQGYRTIPVGYSANDDSDTRVASADYFACGDKDDAADFYGINMYEWCGDSSYTTSGYQARTEEFSNLTIPIFFSEYGCNTVQPRTFTEVAALYGDEMTPVWSGGIVYMYFETTNDYGLVSVDGDSVKTLSDFNYLKSELASIDPSIASTADITASTSGTFDCPATGTTWEAATKLPPTPESSFCDCAETTFSCVVDSSVDTEDYADLFSIVCGYISCDDITANGTSGSYGDYSFCSDKVMLNYILSKYYEEEDSDDACSFDGSASINKDASTASTCSSILTGATASATKKSSSTSASGSGSSDDDSSSSSTASSSSSSAASLYSKRYTSSFGEMTMTLLASTTLLLGVAIFAM